MALKRFFVGFVVVSLVCMLTGCGSDRPETAKVQGTVTLDGSPVEGATVAFFHAEGGPPARAVTDASGAFVLRTFEAGDGAIVGQHQVAVSKIDESSQSAGNAAEAETPASNADLSETAKHLLPVLYSSPSTSGLTVEVKEGMDPVVLDLKSK